MVFKRVAVAADDAADNDERDERPCGAAEEQRFAADFVDEEECGECRESIDYAVDASREKATCLAGETQLAEDCWGVVNDSYDAVLALPTARIRMFRLAITTDELLEEHNAAADGCTLE